MFKLDTLEDKFSQTMDQIENQIYTNSIQKSSKFGVEEMEKL